MPAGILTSKHVLTCRV